MAEGAPKITNLDELDDFLKNRDNSQNVTYVSPIPNSCKEYPCILGIDEAGRGPVLGPMVYGIAFCPINVMTELEALECDDSKALTEVKRDKIFERILGASKSVGWAIEVLSPMFICNNMLGRSKHSLNQVSMDSAIGLIKAAAKAGVKIEHVYVDTVGRPETYQTYLEGLFPEYNFTVAKKADSTYPIVSAASICAKVSRDHSLSVWEFPEGLNVDMKGFGSGYPADPVTKKFLVDYCDPVFGYPQLVRFSWSTSEKALEKDAYLVEWEEIEDESEKPKNNTLISAFFKATKDEGKKAKKQHDFFKRRCLKSTSFL